MGIKAEKGEMKGCVIVNQFFERTRKIYTKVEGLGYHVQER